jgi:alpha-L-rhamnosidase
MASVFFVLVALAAGLVGATPASLANEPPRGNLNVVGLRCEYAVDPLGVDVADPRLFWRVASDARGARQSAWRVLVASSKAFLSGYQGDLWDSGRVRSDQATHVRYAGAPLRSSQQVFWKVRVWDREGRPSSWSDQATWTMGVLATGDWKGIWIAAPGATETLLLRREFDVRSGLRCAIAHVCGLGQYDMTLKHCLGAH